MLAVVLGLGSGAVTMAFLPQAQFVTHAVVGIGAPDPAMRLAMAHAATGAVSSKPVLLRAASSLVASNVSAPDPALSERLAVTLGITGTHATARDARLAEALALSVRATPGASAGTIEILVSDAQADQAAQIANTVAEAFVSDQEDRGAELRRQREIATAARMETLIKTASDAHARLAALGGVGIDPEQAHANVAAQMTVVQNRLGAIRAIMASGSPPLSDRKDVPDAIATAQRTYLDLTDQLAKARETLGDRHTTIISLKEGVARAATSLTTEWKRLEKMAQADLGAARDRENALRKAELPADASRRTALDEARVAARRADEAMTRAEAARPEIPADERIFRLLARAPVPSVLTGVSDVHRSLISALAGLGVFSFVLAVRARRKTSQTAIVAGGETAEKPRKIKASSSYFETTARADLAEDDSSFRAWNKVVTQKTARPELKPVAEERLNDAGLQKAMRKILACLDTVETHYGVPTLMVAANEVDAGTTPIALSLGLAAVDTGRRVLLVERPSLQPALAASTAAEAEPVLVDVFGTLRVVLPASSHDGLYLAPALRNGTRIASNLARDGETQLVDDIANDFDLVIFDGGRASGDDLAADAYLRVGRFTSRRDDERFLAALGVTHDAFIGTMIGRVFNGPDRPAFATTPEPELDRETAPASSVVRLRPGVRRSVAEQMISRRKVAAR